MSDLDSLGRKIVASDRAGDTLSHDSAYAMLLGLYGRIAEKTAAKILFIGNGGSAAISSHSANDYTKNGGLTALCFSDGAVLTCLSNDYGYELAFAKAVELYGLEGDLLVATSSSGASPNILNAVAAARAKGMAVVTLSGFLADNPLRALGDLNFYVPVSHYGYVELLHQIVLHAGLDLYCEARDGAAQDLRIERT